MHGCDWCTGAAGVLGDSGARARLGAGGLI